MRIALVSTPFIAVPPKDYGGTELVVHMLAEGLRARGHDVTLFATGDSETSSRLEALYPEAAWPPNPLIELNHMSWALARVAEEDFDVVHCHAAAALALAALLPGPPIVYTIHHVREPSLSRFYQQFPWVWYAAISDRQRELEIPLPRVTTIHHGLDPEPYAGETKAGDYVCFIGRLSEVKGPHVAIDVAERAGMEIRVAGRIHNDDDDPDFASREVVPRLERPHVRYLGAIGIGEKGPLLRGARAMLVPIDWEEPFGLVMIEAMLAGCPVIAFPRGSAPELIEEGITGFLARDSEDMVEILRNRVADFDRERCRARAIERFSADRMVREYEAWFERARSADPRSALSVPMTA